MDNNLEKYYKEQEKKKAKKEFYKAIEELKEYIAKGLGAKKEG